MYVQITEATGAENGVHFHNSVDESSSEIVERILENSRNLAQRASEKESLTIRRDSAREMDRRARNREHVIC